MLTTTNPMIAADRAEIQAAADRQRAAFAAARPIDPEVLADIRHDEAERAGAEIVRVLAGQQTFFDFRTAGGYVTRLDAPNLARFLVRAGRPEAVGEIIAGLISLDPAVRVRGTVAAQELVASVAGLHADRVARQMESCNG